MTTAPTADRDPLAAIPDDTITAARRRSDTWQRRTMACAISVVAVTAAALIAARTRIAGDGALHATFNYSLFGVAALVPAGITTWTIHRAALERYAHLVARNNLLATARAARVAGPPDTDIGFNATAAMLTSALIYWRGPWLGARIHHHPDHPFWIDDQPPDWHRFWYWMVREPDCFPALCSTMAQESAARYAAWYSQLATTDPDMLMRIQTLRYQRAMLAEMRAQTDAANATATAATATAAAAWQAAQSQAITADYARQQAAASQEVASVIRRRFG